MSNLFKALLIVSNLCVVPYCLGNDLDDGIKLDESINDQLEKTKNISYIKQYAIMKVKDGTAIVNGCQGAGNITIAPGTNLNNTTIVNLSNNKDVSAVCNKK